MLAARMWRDTCRACEKTMPRGVGSEAHLPAKSTQAPENPRLSEAHEHACRTGDPEASPRQRAREPFRLSGRRVSTAPSEARSRRGRISRSHDFDAVYRRGKSVAGRHLVVYIFRRDPADASDAPRLGLSVSRKVGGSVERNRIKRVLREQFANVAHRLPADVDVVVIARPGVAEYEADRGSAALGERLDELITRAAPNDAVTA